MQTMTVHLGANEVGGAFFAYGCGSALAGRLVEPRLEEPRLASARRFLVILSAQREDFPFRGCVPQHKHGQGTDGLLRSGISD